MANKITRINLEPDKPALDGRNLDQLIELWKEDLKRRVKPKSYLTSTGYMKIFGTWWSAYALSFNWLINEATMTDFLHYLETYRTRRGTLLTVHSQHNVMRTVKALLRWAFREKYVGVDFSPIVPNVKGEPQPRSSITIQELHEYLRIAGAYKFGIRNQAIIAVMAGTGIRCVECAGLIVEDVAMTSDLVGTLRLRITKGNRPRVVAFDRFTGEYLSRYLEEIAGSLPAAPLFQTQFGEAFDPESLSSMLARMAKKEGLRVRAHDLRRMFATHWARQRPGEGYGNLLQKQMGHSSFEMTTQYMLQDVEDLVQVMRNEAISPMAALHAYLDRPTR